MQKTSGGLKVKAKCPILSSAVGEYTKLDTNHNMTAEQLFATVLKDGSAGGKENNEGKGRLARTT